MELPRVIERKRYSAHGLDWEAGWRWAKLEAWHWSDEYDEFAFRTRFTPSKASGASNVAWGCDAAEVLSCRSPGQYSARCPAHEDAQASLRIKVLEGGKVLMYCWAGCSTKEVLAAMEADWRDLAER